jgi:hypothetical protein
MVGVPFWSDCLVYIDDWDAGTLIRECVPKYFFASCFHINYYKNDTSYHIINYSISKINL